MSTRSPALPSAAQSKHSIYPSPPKSGLSRPSHSCAMTASGCDVSRHTPRLVANPLTLHPDISQARARTDLSGTHPQPLPSVVRVPVLQLCSHSRSIPATRSRLRAWPYTPSISSTALLLRCDTLPFPTCFAVPVSKLAPGQLFFTAGSTPTVRRKRPADAFQKQLHPCIRIVVVRPFAISHSMRRLQSHPVYHRYHDHSSISPTIDVYFNSRPSTFSQRASGLTLPQGL